MRYRNRSVLFLMLFLAPGLAAFCQNNSKSTGSQAAAAYALIKRVIPSHAQYFSVELIKKTNDQDCFEIETVGSRIMLRGTNGVAIASALNYYLKHFAHCSITWNGTNLKLPARLPEVKQKLRQES